MHDTKIYPIAAPNGSTIVLYGHENGVGIIWRGGRPLKKTAPPPKQPSKPPPKVNGTKDAIMIIDSDDDEPAAPLLPKADFEADEEELDPDQPYPSIIQHLRLSLNTEVLHVAVPPVPATPMLGSEERVPALFSSRMVFAVACTDYSVRIITLPLGPPPDVAKERPSSAKSQYGEDILKIPTHAGHQTVPRGVSLTWTSRGEPRHRQSSEDEMDIDRDDRPTTATGRRSPRKKQSRSRSATNPEGHGFDLLVASHSTELGGLLKLWRFSLTETSVTASNPISPFQTVVLQKPATKVAFNSAQYPKHRHSQLLVADSSGIARIYDPLARRKRSAASSPDSGTFVALFRTSFETPKSSAPCPPVLVTRKPIIDAAWASDGHHILALLADGEWGIWDVGRTESHPASDPSAFSLRGFVGITETERAGGGSASPKSRGGRSALVPMTPNTRRRKEDTLFHGSSSSSSIPYRGAISVASLPSMDGGVGEESVVIWYGSEVYRIPDLAKFWSRATSTEVGGSLGGLNLAQVHDIPLLGESITSIDQFNITVKEARMAIPRSILLSAEHRLIITANANESINKDPYFVCGEEDDEEAELRRADQALLARGELDLGGMSRIMEDMEGSGSHSLVLGNPRKVLFAS